MNFFFFFFFWGGGGGGGGGKGQNIWEGGWREVRIFGGARGGKLFAGCALIGAPAPIQCQMIKFLTLKTDNIANLRTELKSILLEIPSNKIKGPYIKLVHM